MLYFSSFVVCILVVNILQFHVCTFISSLPSLLLHRKSHLIYSVNDRIKKLPFANCLNINQFKQESSVEAKTNWWKGIVMAKLHHAKSKETEKHKACSVKLLEKVSDVKYKEKFETGSRIRIMTNESDPGSWVSFDCKRYCQTYGSVFSNHRLPFHFAVSFAVQKVLLLFFSSAYSCSLLSGVTSSKSSLGPMSVSFPHVLL